MACTEKTLRLVLEGLRMITEVDRRLPDFKEGYSEFGRSYKPAVQSCEAYVGFAASQELYMCPLFVQCVTHENYEVS